MGGLLLMQISDKRVRAAGATTVFLSVVLICIPMYQFGQQNKTLPDMSGYCQGGPLELAYIGEEDKERTEKFRQALQRDGGCRTAVNPIVQDSAFRK